MAYSVLHDPPFDTFGTNNQALVEPVPERRGYYIVICTCQNEELLGPEGVLSGVIGGMGRVDRIGSEE